MTIVAVVVVLVIILIVGVTTFLIVRFLRNVVDGDERPPQPTINAWLQARQAARLPGQSGKGAGPLRESALVCCPSPLDFHKAPTL
jgi:hypothetical protein